MTCDAATLRKEAASADNLDMFRNHVLKYLDECEAALPTVAAEAHKGGGKRKPSAWNLYAGSCMKGGKKTLKECSVEYKQKKMMGTVGK